MVFRTLFFFFFFNDTATTEIYTLSLHDALPILFNVAAAAGRDESGVLAAMRAQLDMPERRSEEHTSELQSQSNLVCRLLLEKKKKKTLFIKIMSVLTSAMTYAWPLSLLDIFHCP